MMLHYSPIALYSRGFRADPTVKAIAVLFRDKLMSHIHYGITIMTLKNIKWLSQTRPGETHSSKVKWRTILGLLLMYSAVVLNWQWIWGIFSLYWIFPDFFTGVTYFIEPISRRENPILYWLILITWVAFSIVMFFPVS